MNSRTRSAAALLAVLFMGPSTVIAQKGPARGVSRAECDLPEEALRGNLVPNTWPDGIVPYRFNANVTAENRQRALDAMAEIEAVCRADFVAWSGQVAYLNINASNANNSCIGYGGGVCTVNIADWLIHGTIVHEFGHALGLRHEHQRTDRDEYVQVNLAQTCNAGCNYCISGTPFGPYDFESIMHYDSIGWSRDEGAVMTVRPEYADWKYYMGRQERLSNGDVWALTQLYGGARPPRTFPLTAPADRARVGPAWTPSFAWGAAEAANMYHLQVDDDPSFASPEIDALTSGLMHTASTPLADGRVYFWRVLASNGDGETEARPRPVQSFLTDSTTLAVLYVDTNAGSGGTGAAWAAALRDLSAALDIANCSAGQVGEVRVAQGVYRPGRGTLDRESAFHPVGGVMIKGGYAGAAAPDPDARDPSLYPTVLSGDLAQNDQPGFANYDDNCSHVIAAMGVTPECTLDGVTITAGNADGPNFAGDGAGGGIFSRDSLLNLNDCRLVACSANTAGGGVSVRDYGSFRATRTIFEGNRTTYPISGGGAGAGLHKSAGTAITLIACTFRGNTGFQGAGANLQGVGTASLSECVFENNTASLWSAGLQTYRSQQLVADRCTFRGNMALHPSQSYAGAFGNYGLTTCGVRATSLLTNCIFSDNSAGWTGGAVNNDDSGTVTLANCTIVGNSAANGRGGGITNTADFGGANSMTIVNSIVRGNTGGQVLNTGAGSTTAATYSNIEGGLTGAGNINADPLFVDAMIDDHRPGRGSPCIDAGTNAALAAGILDDHTGDPRFHDDPWTTNTGVPDAARPALPIVDMGAHEFQGTSCAADFNASGAVSVQDIFDFLAAYFSGDNPSADFNDSGAISVQDIFDFLAAYFTGCP